TAIPPSTCCGWARRASLRGCGCGRALPGPGMPHPARSWGPGVPASAPSVSTDPLRPEAPDARLTTENFSEGHSLQTRSRVRAFGVGRVRGGSDLFEHPLTPTVTPTETPTSTPTFTPTQTPTSTPTATTTRRSRRRRQAPRVLDLAARAAGVAELADARDLGSRGATREGSSPSSRTRSSVRTTRPEGIR